MACSDGDALHANELGSRLALLLDLETHLDGLADPLDQRVEGARLSMAAGQLRDAGHIVTVPIELDDNAKLTLTDSSHEKVMAENPLGRNTPESDQRSGSASHPIVGFCQPLSPVSRFSFMLAPRPGPLIRRHPPLPAVAALGPPTSR